MACRLTVLAASVALAGLSACTVRTAADVPAYAPAYSQAPAYYAPARPYAAPGYAYGAPAVAQPYDSYCAEAVGVAQDAAARAALTGTDLAADRARRTAQYAQRDC